MGLVWMSLGGLGMLRRLDLDGLSVGGCRTLAATVRVVIFRHPSTETWSFQFLREEGARQPGDEDLFSDEAFPMREKGKVVSVWVLPFSLLFLCYQSVCVEMSIYFIFLI